MKVLKNKKTNYTVTLEIEADYADVEKATEPAFQELVKDAKVPGFRQGKVPRNIFEKHYGKEMLINRASVLVMNDCYKQAIESEKLQPVDYPQNVDVQTLEEGKPFIFTLSVDVKPEIKLKKYKGLKVPKESDKVAEADIQKELEHIREYYADYAVVDREVRKDDLAGYAQKAFDGEAPVEELTKEQTGSRVGANFISEEFDNALLGMKLKETKKFTAKIKDDYFSKDLAGKTLTFEVLMTEIKERKLPELNDELAKKASGKETLADLRKDIQEHLEKTKKEQVENEFKTKLVDELIKENEFDIPPVLVEEKLDGMLRELEGDLQQKKLDFERYLQIIGKNKDQVRDEYKPMAEKRARLELLLGEIAEKEEIKPTDLEISAELEKLIKGSRKEEPTADELEKLKKNIPDYTRKYIESYLIREKSMNFLIENAKTK